MAARRPLPSIRDVGVEFTGELTRMVQITKLPPAAPASGLSIWQEVADLINADIKRGLVKSVGSVLHGARMAGSVAVAEVEQRVVWIAVGGEAGDGKNCSDCLGLHGTEMTLEQFLDTQYTTACDGNCRCTYAPADAVSGQQIEAIATSELEDYQE